MMRGKFLSVLSVAMLLALPLYGASTGAAAQEPAMGFGGGGPMVGLFLPDLAEVNDFLLDHGFSRFGETLITVGGSGRGGVIGGLALGGAGWGGWVESNLDDLAASLGVGFGGFDLGYAVGGDERSVLTIGVVLGGGGSSLELWGYAPENGPESMPAGIVIEPSKLEFSSVFIGIQPYCDMQVQLLDWLGLGVRIGYLLAPFEVSWGDAEIALYSPDLNLSGPFVGFSIVFGGIGAEEPEPLAVKQ